MAKFIPRRDNESQEHWEYRIFVRGFYLYKDILGNRLWLDRWGPRPPDNEAHYIEPTDNERFQLDVRRSIGPLLDA